MDDLAQDDSVHSDHSDWAHLVKMQGSCVRCFDPLDNKQQKSNLYILRMDNSAHSFWHDYVTCTVHTKASMLKIMRNLLMSNSYINNIELTYYYK